MEWISVEYHLPKYQKATRSDYNPNTYLCYTSFDVYELCDIDEQGNWVGDLRGGDGGPLEVVTHYCKLPEPPKENKNLSQQGSQC